MLKNIKYKANLIFKLKLLWMQNIILRFHYTVDEQNLIYLFESLDQNYNKLKQKEMI